MKFVEQLSLSLQKSPHIEKILSPFVSLGYDPGIITEQEFTLKKAELLKRWNSFILSRIFYVHLYPVVMASRALYPDRFI
jgi:hypothetical protein